MVVLAVEVSDTLVIMYNVFLTFCLNIGVAVVTCKPFLKPTLLWVPRCWKWMASLYMYFLAWCCFESFSVLK